MRSDGTAAGTALVKDIRPGSGSALAADLSVATLGGVVLFQANDGVNGAELWRSDGTNAGTAMVRGIRPGASSGVPINFAVLGSTAYFSATDGTTAPAGGTELWQSDGTTAGTVLTRNINPGTLSSSLCS